MSEVSIEPTGTGAQSCHRCQCAIEAGDLRCAVCGLSVPEEQRVVDRPIVQILRCGTCGAAVSYEVEAQAPRCAFCGSVAHVERPTDPIEQPRFILPFRVTPEQAQQALRGWLGSLGFFRPSDLATQATLESLRPLWWVAWIFDARALISWAADSNAGAGRSQWAPHSGQTRMDFDRILVSASRGLTNDEAGALTGYFDLATAQTGFSGPAGAVCEGFQVQRSAARQTIASAIESVARSRLPSQIPGSSFRKLRVAVLLEGLRTDRFALPTYVFAYRYRGKLYRALVHGQNPASTFGTAPYSVLKILLVIGGGLLALLLILLIFGGIMALLGSA
jgi:hypothetical protein